MNNAKKLCLGVFLIYLTMNNALAEKKPNSFCENISSLAETIMTRRQAGAEMSRLIKSIDDAPIIAIDKVERNDSKKIDKLAKRFIVQAYKYPFLYDEGLKKEAIVEFTNSTYLECYQAQMK